MERTVLSVQSHVAHGIVGNRAATFPLQVMGWEVDAVHTVNFANHSGYRKRAGDGVRTTGDQLQTIFDGMDNNGLLEPSRLLTGYTPNADCAGGIVLLVHKLRAKNPNLIYCLDPVLGDNGALYVSTDMIPLYRDLLCNASIITPNYFEVETLVGFELDSLEALRKALTMLHKEYGVPHVVISSIPITKQRATWLPDQLTRIKRSTIEGITWAENPLLCVASSSEQDSILTSRVHAMGIPQIRGYFSGVGDLFSALVLGHYSPSEATQDASTTPLSYAVCNAVRTTHAILRKTAIASAQVPGSNHTDDELDKEDPNRRARRMKARELRIVGSIDIILSAGKSELGAVEGLDEMKPWEGFWA